MKRKELVEVVALAILIIINVILIAAPTPQKVVVSQLEVLVNARDQIECVNSSGSAAELEIYLQDNSRARTIDLNNNGSSTIYLSEYSDRSLRIDILQPKDTVSTKCYLFSFSNSTVTSVLNPDPELPPGEIKNQATIALLPINSFQGLSNVLVLNKVSPEPALVNIEVYSDKGEKIIAPNLANIDFSEEKKEIDLNIEVGSDFSGSVKVSALTGAFDLAEVRSSENTNSIESSRQATSSEPDALRTSEVTQATIKSPVIVQAANPTGPSANSPTSPTTVRPSTSTTTTRPPTTPTTTRPPTTTTTTRPPTTTSTTRPPTTTTTTRPPTTPTTTRPPTTTSTTRPPTTTSTTRPPTTTSTTRAPTTTTTIPITCTGPTCQTCSEGVCEYGDDFIPCLELTLKTLSEQLKFDPLNEEYLVLKEKKERLELIIEELTAGISSAQEQLASFRKFRNENCGASNSEVMCITRYGGMTGQAAEVSVKEYAIKAVTSAIPCIGNLAIEVYDVSTEQNGTRTAQAAVTTYSILKKVNPIVPIIGNSDPLGTAAKACVLQVAKDTKLAKAVVVGAKFAKFTKGCFKAVPLVAILDAGWYMTRYAINKINGPACPSDQLKISIDTACFGPDFDFFPRAPCKTGATSLHPYCNELGEGANCCPGNPHHTGFPLCNKERFKSIKTILLEIQQTIDDTERLRNSEITELNSVIRRYTEINAEREAQLKKLDEAKKAQKDCEDFNEEKTKQEKELRYNCGSEEPENARFCKRPNIGPWRCGYWKTSKSTIFCGDCPSSTHACNGLGGNPKGDYNDPFRISSAVGTCRRLNTVSENCYYFHLCKKGTIYTEIYDPATGQTDLGCFTFRSANGFESFYGDDMNPGVGNYNQLRRECGNP